MTTNIRKEIISAVTYHRNAIPSYQLEWEGQWFGSDDPKACVDRALESSFDSLAALDHQISEIDPDVDAGLYEELVFCRNELEEKLDAN
jgi:hypothetical protein